MRQRKKYHRCVKKSCTRTKRENSVKTCAKNKSSAQRVCRSSARTHTGTRTMLLDTKLRRTLAYSFQQFHLPFHLQFVTLELCSQHSLCDPTADRHSNICSELRMCHLLCMFGESVFALIPDHEVRAAKLTNRWISGCWWKRDTSSDEHLVGTKRGLQRVRICVQLARDEFYRNPCHRSFLAGHVDAVTIRSCTKGSDDKGKCALHVCLACGKRIPAKGE